VTHRVKLRRSAAAVIAGVAVVSLVGAGGAVAKSLITGADVKNGSLHLVDLDQHGVAKLKGQQGAAGPTGSNGLPGAKGAPGATGLTGAYYAVAFYDVGVTNAGAIATVACSSLTDVAITGGVQVLGIGDTPAEIDAANMRNTPVSSSFPGRMDWATNTPKVDRLDGWIVQFGGTTGANPLKEKVWALCVPNTSIPVVQTFTESAG
jgi:hypothetical protein